MHRKEITDIQKITNVQNIEPKKKLFIAAIHFIPRKDTQNGKWKKQAKKLPAMLTDVSC
jgi:hypothetical protein